jgi:hypothetical protein
MLIAFKVKEKQDDQLLFQFSRYSKNAIVNQIFVLFSSQWPTDAFRCFDYLKIKWHILEIYK